MSTSKTIGIAIGAAAAFLAVSTLVAAYRAPGSSPSVSEPSRQTAVERGAYLVRANGCHDCHTPFKMGPNGPERDFTRALTGHPAELEMPPAPKLGDGPWVYTGSATNTAFAGPWGVSYSMNLTPDKETGIGLWTEEQFVQTLRTGRHLGVSRPVLPPMPIEMTSAMDVSDLRALYAYLMSVKPIRNAVPAPIPPL